LWVSIPLSLEYCESLPSRPIQTQEIPKATSCSMVYEHNTLAELKTYRAQDLLFSIIRANNRKARFLCSRKFSSMTKSELTCISFSS
jgi:hypothetical protein